MPEPEKKLIEVTVEKRLRVCKEIEATEEEIEFLRRGENPFESEFSDEEAVKEMFFEFTGMKFDQYLMKCSREITRR